MAAAMLVADIVEKTSQREYSFVIYIQRSHEFFRAVSPIHSLD